MCFRGERFQCGTHSREASVNFNSTHIFCCWRGGLPCVAARRTLVPQPGLKPVPPLAVEDCQESPSRHILMECLPSIRSVASYWERVDNKVRHASVEFESNGGRYFKQITLK